MKQQKNINKMLKNISTSKKVYNTYGYILKIKLSTILFILDWFILSFRLLSLLALILIKKNKDKHLFNIDITKIMDVIKKWKNLN